MKIYLRIIVVSIVIFLLGFLAYLSLMSDLGYRNLRSNIAAGLLGNEIERYGTVTNIDPVSKMLTFDSLNPDVPGKPMQSLTISGGGATIVEQYISTTTEGYTRISGTASTFSDIPIGSRVHIYLRPTAILKADTIYFGNPL